MVLADLMRAALVGMLAMLHASLVPAFAVSAGTQLFNAAASALVVPDLVDEDEIVTAGQLGDVGRRGAVADRPRAGGGRTHRGARRRTRVRDQRRVVRRLGADLARARSRGAHVEARGWSAPAGVVVRGHRLLSRLALVQGLAALSAGATSGLLVVLASRWLRVGPSGFGLLLGAIGLGAATGPLVLRSRIRPGSRRCLYGPFALRGVVDLVLASVSNAIVAGAALAAYGVGTSTGMLAYPSTLQMQVRREVRGRSSRSTTWSGTARVCCRWAPAACSRTRSGSAVSMSPAVCCS